MRKTLTALVILTVIIGDLLLLKHTEHHGNAILLTIIGIAVLIVLAPGFPKMFWKPTDNRIAASSPIVPMSRARLLAVYGVVLLFVGGSVADLSRDTEHWPWSCYPMYSFPEGGETFSDLRLYGVTTANTEIALFDNEQYLQPFDQSRLAEALAAAAPKPGLRNGLLNCLQRYERLRRDGRHNGPALSAIRFYKVYWHLDGWGRNIDSPDKMELIEEVRLPDNQKS